MSNPQAASVDSVMALYDSAMSQQTVYSLRPSLMRLEKVQRATDAIRAEVTRLAGQGAAPQAVQADPRFPAAHYGHDLRQDQAARVSPAEKTARMLTEGELWCESGVGAFMAPERAIAKFCEVNAGCRIPADGKLEGGE